jgi:hypothetical protein
MGLTWTLECWIVGDPLTERFLVEVDSNKRVKDLRRAIKQAERDDGLRNIKAVNIMLWKVCKITYRHDPYLANQNRFPYRSSGITGTRRIFAT